MKTISPMKKVTLSMLAIAALTTVVTPALAESFQYRIRSPGVKASSASPAGTPAGGSEQVTSPGSTQPGAPSGDSSGTAPGGTGQTPIVPPTTPPELITANFTLYRSGLSMNRATFRYNGTVEITNKTGTTLTGPFHFALADLTPGVTLYNLAGTYNGAAYVTFAANTIAPGESITVSTIFDNPQKIGINYTSMVYRGTM